MMTTTILIDHPYQKSFNHQIKENLISHLITDKKDYQVIDLNADRFNPVMTENELAVYQAGKVLDPLIEKYMEILKDTQQLIIIFPVWWYATPASLKGFLDKILLNQFAFYDEGNGIQPLLKIDSAVVFSTSEQSTESLKERCNDSYRHQLITTLKDVGVKKVAWHHLDLIGTISSDERQEFLNRAYKNLK